MTYRKQAKSTIWTGAATTSTVLARLDKKAPMISKVVAKERAAQLRERIKRNLVPFAPRSRREIHPMTLDEKRLVIEALLCAAASNNVSLIQACGYVGCSEAEACRVMDETYKHIPVSKKVRVEHRLIEAAYRLAASEWALVVEWFWR